jgi:glycerophosphoryl diester phosphodiesterase
MITHKNSPLVIAHRGASGLAPENTLAAFRLAIALGADGVEMDVQLSADGQPIVIHDARLNRTTNETGLVASFTADKLSRLDAGIWFDRRLAIRPRLRAMAEEAQSRLGSRPVFAGEPVPTLEATLALLAQTALKRLYIELKPAPKSRSGLLEAVLALVEQFGLERSVTLLSFDHALVKLAKEMAPGMCTAIILPVAVRQMLTARSVLRLAEVARADEVALHFSLVTRRLVTTLHEHGIQVSAWTVNRKLIMRRLIACRVDSIMTDFPNRLISVIQSNSDAPRSLLRRHFRNG